MSRLGHVVLVDVTRRMTVGHVTAVREALVAARDEGEPQILVRVRAGVQVPTTEVRRSFVDFLLAERGRVRDIHIALEGHGFWAATMTALVANVSRAAPFATPMHVHTSLEQASAALEELPVQSTSGLIDRAAIARAFEQAG